MFSVILYPLFTKFPFLTDNEVFFSPRNAATILEMHSLSLSCFLPWVQVLRGFGGAQTSPGGSGLGKWIGDHRKEQQRLRIVGMEIELMSF